MHVISCRVFIRVMKVPDAGIDATLLFTKSIWHVSLSLSKTRGRGAWCGRTCGHTPPQHQLTSRSPRRLPIHRAIQTRPRSRSHQSFLVLEKRNQAFKPLKFSVIQVCFLHNNFLRISQSKLHSFIHFC